MIEFHVQFVVMSKTGLHFTTPALKKISDRTKQLQAQYSQLQAVVVEKAVEAARSYIPLIEAVSGLVAELDVYSSFAASAALAPVEYVRPVIRPLGSGLLKLVKARHPCVELMDNVDYIANNCILDRERANFQLITGPNMV